MAGMRTTALRGLVALLTVAATGLDAAHAAKVGVTAAVNPNATGAPPGAGVRTLVLGEDVVFDEVITTDADALVQLLMLDGTALTVGPHATMTIDEYVYDPDAGTGKIALTLARGAMRFVGGKISKQADAASITTPLGNIGIRGAIVETNVQDGSVTVAAVFSEEVTFQSGGVTQVIPPSRKLQAGVQTDGTVQTEQSDYTEQDAAQMDTLLSGPPGSTGSSPAPREAVAGLADGGGLSQVNAGKAPADLPGNGSPVSPQGAVGQQQLAALGAGPASSINPNNPVADLNTGQSNPPPTTPAPGSTTAMRVFWTPDTFSPEWNPGIVVTNPGLYGLVGYSNANSVVTFQQNVSGTTRVGAVNGAPATVPIVTPLARNPATGLSVQPITASHGSDSLSGSVIFGFGNFAFYALTNNADADDVSYAVSGTTTDMIAFNASLAGAGRITRDYYLLPDRKQSADAGVEVTVPFLSPHAVEALPASAFDQGYPVLSAVETDGDFLRLLMGGLIVTGTGPSQQSVITISSGDIFENEESIYQYGAGLRGSQRLSAGDFAYEYGGPLESVAGANGQHFFGPAAETLMLSGAVNRDDPMGGFAIDGSVAQAEQLFSTMQVASLIPGSEAPLGTLQDRQLSGYSAGMIESYAGAALNVTSVASNRLDDFSQFFDGAASIGAELVMMDVFDQNPEIDQLNTAYGRGINGNTENYSGVYVTDDRYAARENRNPTSTSMTSDPGGPGVVLQVADDIPNGYFVGSDTFVDPTQPEESYKAQLFPGSYGGLGVTECVCAFLEWGFWGARLWFQDPGLVDGEVRVTSHLVPWAAGDISADIDVPTSGSATYGGHAVGNVRDAAGNQYLAAGDLAASVAFGGTHSGTLTISNFDGHTYSGALAPGSGANFAGTGGVQLQNTGTPDVTQSMFQGSFANAPGGPGANGAAGGMLGNFALEKATGYGAAGIFVGDLQAFTP